MRCRKGLVLDSCGIRRVTLLLIIMSSVVLLISGSFLLSIALVSHVFMEISCCALMAFEYDYTASYSLGYLPDP